LADLVVRYIQRFLFVGNSRSIEQVEIEILGISVTKDKVLDWPVCGAMLMAGGNDGL